MKKGFMKSVFTILLTLSMLFTCMPVSYVFAIDSQAITVDAVKVHDTDKTATVNIVLSDNPGITSMRLNISYDTEVMLLTEVTDGGILGVSNHPSNLETYPYILSWANDTAPSDITANGTIATLEFQLKDRIKPGDYAISVAYDNDNDDILNFDLDTVDFQINNGKITVEAAPVPVIGFTLDKTTATVETEDETLTLTPLFSPETATNKNITWTSSDNEIATVTDGAVTLIKKGIVTITATTEDGGYAASCVVIINCSHRKGNSHPAESSTCIKQGHEAYDVCEECGDIINGSDAKLPLADHTYIENADAQYLETAATCNSKAVYYRSCSVCGVQSNVSFFEYGEFDMSNHVGGTYKSNQKEATCYEEGYTGDTYCSGCNTKLSSGTVIGKNEHNPASVWSTNSDYHWKDCQSIGCGNIIDKAAHSGGEATCTKKAICDVCCVEYGVFNAKSHKSTELRNVKSATEDEEGYTGDIFCKDCEKIIETGTVIPKLNHTHNMTTVAYKAATCTAEGNITYWQCTKCGKYYSDADGKTEITLPDTVISKLDHSYTILQHNDVNHWYKCGNCVAITETVAHNGGNATCVNKAICIVCGVPYGELSSHTYVEKSDTQYLKAPATCNSKAVYYKSCSVCGEKSDEIFESGEFNGNNHVGGTYIKDQKEATCYEKGYTGDTYCSDCDAKLFSGTVIGKNEHNPASVWSTDSDYHWKDCQTVGCGNIIDKSAHAGGEATCKNKAGCSVCGVAYGTVSADNHVNTEIRNDKVATEDEAGYTGDTYCNDCKKVIKIGATMPKLDHTHSMTAVAQKDATCTANGNIAYWHCTKCDKYYSDADGKTEIALADTVIEQLEHNYSVLQKNDNSHWYKCADCDAVTTLEAHAGGTATCAEKAVCSVCGTAYGALLSHTYVEKADAQYLKSAATCNSKAVYYKSCSVCGKKSEEVFESGEFDADNHAGVATYIKDQKEATCYEEGYSGDTYCSGCNTKLSSGTVIGKNEHNPASVWSNDENYHWKDCQTVGCGNIIDKAAHTGDEATCTKKAICSVCNVEYGTVNVDNHKNTEIRNIVEATCTTDGYTGDSYCKDCGTKTADGMVIPAAHKLNKIDAKAATHEADGNIEYYKCSVCGKLFNDTDVATEITLEDTIIAKGAHNYGDTYKSDAENHWKECGCGNIIEKSAHVFGNWSVIKEATTTENGSKERTCSVCGYKATEVIPAMGTATEPTEPTNPAEPNKPSDTTEKSPQTGDTSNMTLWIALMFISALGVGTMTALNRKKRVK